LERPKCDTGHEQALGLHLPEKQTLRIQSVGTQGRMQKSEELVPEITNSKCSVAASEFPPVSVLFITNEFK
jgi:hypothetical protein